jgi:hypothetical protein
MRFQDAARDARAVVYAGIQADPLVGRVASLLADASLAERWMARAVMNGQRTDAGTWRCIFPAVFGDGAPNREHAEALLAACLAVADHGEEARNQYRGAAVEELTAQLLARRASPVRRERRVLFDGVRAEIHPYDVTVEADCKWGGRGINADVLSQLDDARTNAAAEESVLRVALVVFDARKTCLLRLARSTTPHEQTELVTIDDIDSLGGRTDD